MIEKRTLPNLIYQRNISAETKTVSIATTYWSRFHYTKPSSKKPRSSCHYIAILCIFWPSPLPGSWLFVISHWLPVIGRVLIMDDLLFITNYSTSNFGLISFHRGYKTKRGWCKMNNKILQLLCKKQKG